LNKSQNNDRIHTMAIGCILCIVKELIYQSGVNMDNSKERTSRCLICGAQIMQLKCKSICTNCGFTSDCSDPN